MSFKLFLIKGAKPLLAAVAVAGSAYGYKEWEKAKVAMKISDNEKDMVALFDKIDHDHSGSIDKKELKEALAAAGINVNKIALEAMMHAADEDHDGTISKQEWIHMCQRINIPHPDHTFHPNMQKVDHSGDVTRPVMKEEMWKETHGRHDKK